MNTFTLLTATLVGLAVLAAEVLGVLLALAIDAMDLWLLAPPLLAGAAVAAALYCADRNVPHGGYRR